MAANDAVATTIIMDRSSEVSPIASSGLLIYESKGRLTLAQVLPNHRLPKRLRSVVVLVDPVSKDLVKRWDSGVVPAKFGAADADSTEVVLLDDAGEFFDVPDGYYLVQSFTAFNVQDLAGTSQKRARIQVSDGTPLIVEYEEFLESGILTGKLSPESIDISDKFANEKTAADGEMKE